MDRIFFENIRCFASRQTVRLAPLTVLVGENSSGKSTFLALVRLAWDLASHLGFPDFNEDPFQLGAYDQIVSVGNSRSRRKSPFTIGMEVNLELKDHGEVVKVGGRFGAHRGQPVLEEWTWECAPYQVIVSFKKNGRLASMAAHGPSGGLVLDSGSPFIAEFLANRGDLLGGLTGVLLLNREKGRREQKTLHEQISDQELFALTDRLFHLREKLGRRPYAFAPVRTKPKRTYDPIQPLENPEGAHIPMVLAFRRDPEEWVRIVDALESFGRESGLFNKVEVRRLGKLNSDPFQIQVQIGTNSINLIDVGYGVSQVLPIIVDSVRGEKGGTFLLQQPEVHLHPKAQAELGSFLGAFAMQQEKRFVIETHSDYLVDRIRMDIRDRKGITPEDVSLLYFERHNGEAHIHRLELDEEGNILDPPPGYRRFFLEEERRFLGG